MTSSDVRASRLRTRFNPLALYAKLRQRGGGTPGSQPLPERRRALSDRYIRGSGVEVGPLHQPLPVPATATVRYVDRMPTDELRRQYPELSEYDLVEPDVVDDGETLGAFADASLDFVIANHFIEHCQNPVSALENHLRVLRPGGVLYMAVPDKRRTFDRDRPTTPLEHLVRDYELGPAWSHRAHFEEYARLVDKADDPRAHADELIVKDYSIHFHVWTPDTFRALLDDCRERLGFAFAVEEFVENDFEFIAVLRNAA